MTCNLQVGSCNLQVTNYQLQTVSYPCEIAQVAKRSVQEEARRSLRGSWHSFAITNRRNRTMIVLQMSISPEPTGSYDWIMHNKRKWLEKVANCGFPNILRIIDAVALIGSALSNWMLGAVWSLRLCGIAPVLHCRRTEVKGCLSFARFQFEN